MRRMWAGLGLLLALSVGFALRGGAGSSASAEIRAASGDERVEAPEPGLRGAASPEADHGPSTAVEVVEPTPTGLEERIEAAAAARRQAEQAQQVRFASNLASLESKAQQAEQEGRAEYAAALRTRAETMRTVAAR